MDVENQGNQQVPQLPPPHPHYEEAETDSIIIVKFIGNTPGIYELRMFGIMAEHMAAASKRLEYEFEKMQRIADARNAQMGVQVTDKMPEKPKSDEAGGIIKP